ncbi:hypothetical protein CAEBREN_12514 [Caenorhabditis brenneri]|uniref:Uncharacterized protein n=1 Tax=Caenorhabditis brenneri TaxID=135651 RepID=G0P613_CAEBE|nr:hypothetical protein CAEBREN_12514 [Caenorhabditis brenneri]
MENYNLRIAEYEVLIEVLKMDIVQLNHNLRINQYASAAERERDARQSTFNFLAIVKIRELIRGLEEQMNQLIVHNQEAMARMNLGGNNN